MRTVCIKMYKLRTWLSRSFFIGKSFLLDLILKDSNHCQYSKLNTGTFKQRLETYPDTSTKQSKPNTEWCFIIIATFLTKHQESFSSERANPVRSISASDIKSRLRMWRTVKQRGPLFSRRGVATRAECGFFFRATRKRDKRPRLAVASNGPPKVCIIYSHKLGSSRGL